MTLFYAVTRQGAKVYEKLGKYDDALRDYVRVSQSSMDSAEANLGIGNIYLRRRKYEAAVEHFDLAIFTNSRSTEAYLGRGTAYLELGKIYSQSQLPEDTEKAFENYRKAIKDFDSVTELDLEDSFKEAYLRRAKAFEKIGEKEKAEADRQKYEELSSYRQK